MKTFPEILNEHVPFLHVLPLPNMGDIEGAANEYAQQFKPEWIPLTEEIESALPIMKFYLVWYPERDMFFHAYRRPGEWVCAELGSYANYATFSHYMSPESIGKPFGL